ncbi:MAG: two-component system, OmpR family, phosphate regulon sensor histidine kinase PhoR [Verrucomicrobiota bacterium]|jgi:signal transduction histidine kinase
MADRLKKPTRSPGFLRHGILILLPVVVLSAIGFISLQQDSFLAQREAVERAQALADESVESLWTALADTSRLSRDLAFQVDANGALLFPPPVTTVPLPQPFLLSDLNPAQEKLWRFVMESDGLDLTNAIAMGNEFFAAHPPERFEAAMRFRVAQLLATNGARAEARSMLASIWRQSPSIVGETGLPLIPLARLKWIELADNSDPSRGIQLTTLRSAAISNPSPVTPFLLDRAAALAGFVPAADPWRVQWEQHQILRKVHAAATALHRNKELPSTQDFPRFAWAITPSAASAVDGTNQPGTISWITTRAETNAAGTWFVCRPSLEDRLARPGVGALEGGPRFISPTWLGLRLAPSVLLSNWPPDPLPAAIQAIQQRLPLYFGLSVAVMGHALVASNDLPFVARAQGGKGGGQYWKSILEKAAPPLLAVSRRWEDGVEALEVGIHLVGREMLYERQRSRSLLFCLLIAASAAAACVGFVAARRAFLRSEQLSEMKSNFVSSVSHELRAPIASVRLMAENLERGKIPDPARQQDYFRFIMQECRRLGTLIENVLDFARIEQGRKQYDFEPTDMSALVAQAVKLMEPAAAEKKVTLRIEEAAGGAAPVSGSRGAPSVDGPALQQALVNLLDNAIKHSPNGGIVAIAASFNSTGDAFHLSVADDGPGIAPAEHDKIFERFYRCGSELRRETPGVGIGLSIVKHIAEAHGGRVSVQSEPGHGSRFTMELPIRPGAAHR